MAEPTPNKFAQLKQFWQKGKKEEGEAATTGATTAAHRQLPPQATQAPAPPTTTAATAPAFDPYGATDDLSFVPEEEDDEGVKVKNVESQAQAADSLYAMDEQFVEEKDEEETNVEEKKDEGVAQAQASSPESLYAAAETFVDEEVVEEDKAVATPKGTEEDEAGENRYAYTAAPSDVAYAMDDEFNPEGDASSTSAPAPSYGADSSAFQYAPQRLIDCYIIYLLS